MSVSTPVRRALAGATAILLAVLLGPTAGAPTAQAFPDPSDPLLVEVTALEPLFPQPGQPLTVRGTVTNRSGQAAEAVQGLLRVSPERLTSRSDVAAVTDLTTARRGVTQSRTLTPITEQLAPSTSVDFAVTVPADDLPLGISGVYAFFVEVRAEGIGSYDTAFPVPWFPNPDALAPSRIAVVAPIRSAVDLTATNTLLSPALSSSMAPGGALYTLTSGSAIAAQNGAAINWLIDPALPEAAEKLGSGAGEFPPANTDPAAAATSIAAWLETLLAGSSAATAAAYLTPYAEVDASGVLQAGMPDLLTEAIQRSTPQQVVPPEEAAEGPPIARVRGTVAIGPGGNSTTASLLAYREASVSTILLRASALPPVEQLSYTPSGVSAVPLPDGSSITAILPDEMLGENLLRPAQTPAERFRMQQGLLADASMITLELPQSSRTVVLAIPEQLAMEPEILAQALISLSEAPSTALVDLAALQSADVPRVERRLVLDEGDAGRLPGEYLAPIPSLEQRLSAFARVTVDPLAFAEDFRTAILRSASANWRSDLPRGEELLATTEAELTAEEQKVTTISTGTVTFSGNSGNLPLTISNDLDQAVEVGVLLEAEPSVRLAFAPPDLVIVDAGKRISVEIPVEVFGTGPLPVTVVLTDRSGTPFISTGDLVIRSAANTAAAAVVAILGAVAFLVLVVWRFRKKGADDS